ncbi:MAG: hypothetical protein JW900_01175 [Anaerolineae bacterium]|nr:hypothetical protein [Anaerolineae bacterium]
MMRKFTIFALTATLLFVTALSWVPSTAEASILCFQGCTPGFWKNHPSAWEGYSPETLVGDVFDVPYPELAGDPLLKALNYGGGDDEIGAAMILLRAGVAALLNAAHPDVAYRMPSPEDVIGYVNYALARGNRELMIQRAGYLDYYNNRGCPIGGPSLGREGSR